MVGGRLRSRMDVAMTRADKRQYIFRSDEEASFQFDLGLLDTALEALAARYALRFDHDAGRGWPGRRLTAKKRFKRYSLVIALDAEYLQSGIRSWSVSENWMFDFLGVVRRQVTASTLLVGIRFDAATTTLVAERVKAAVAAAMSSS